MIVVYIQCCTLFVNIAALQITSNIHIYTFCALSFCVFSNSVLPSILEGY